MAFETENGSGLISEEMYRWDYDRDVELGSSRLHKPADREMIESFNAKLRQERIGSFAWTTIDAILRLGDTYVTRQDRTVR